MNRYGRMPLTDRMVQEEQALRRNRGVKFYDLVASNSETKRWSSVSKSKLKSRITLAKVR
jgi:hypothetical protein